VVLHEEVRSGREVCEGGKEHVSGVGEKYVKVVKDVSDESEEVVRCAAGMIEVSGWRLVCSPGAKGYFGGREGP